MEERNLGHAGAAVFFKIRTGREFILFHLISFFFLFHFTAKGKLNNNNNNNKNFDVYKCNFTQQVSYEDIAIFPLLLQQGQATNLRVVDRI